MNSPLEKKQTTSPFRYAIGMFGTSIPINMFKTYAFIFYVDRLGLKTEQFSLIIAIYTIVDAIDNPIYGFLSDRTRTKWGRRRPWLVLGTPLLALFFIMFFNPPTFAGGSTELFVYCLLTYILTGTLDSLINANYGALFPELFKTDSVRATTNAMRQAFQLVAMIISIALTPVVTGKIGFSATAIIYGIIAIAVIVFCAVGCKENPEASTEEKPNFLKTLIDMFKNPKFWIYGLANAFYSAAMSLVMASVPLFVKYTLSLEDIASTILLGSVLIVAIIGVLIWALLVKKFTLIPVWRAALIFMALAFIPLYFANGLISAIIFSCFIGFGIAGVMATMDLIGAKIMDYDTYKSGLRREGIYSSAMGFMNRLNGLFVALAYILVSRVYGYESGEVTGDNPGGAARFLLVVFPFVLMIISCIFSWFMHFKGMPDIEDGVLVLEENDTLNV